jgi:hypothetical protein
VDELKRDALARVKRLQDAIRLDGAPLTLSSKQVADLAAVLELAEGFLEIVGPYAELAAKFDAVGKARRPQEVLRILGLSRGTGRPRKYDSAQIADLFTKLTRPRRERETLYVIFADRNEPQAVEVPLDGVKALRVIARGTGQAVDAAGELLREEQRRRRRLGLPSLSGIPSRTHLLR